MVQMEKNAFYQKLLAFVSSRVRNTQDAEDIVQNVFVKAQLKSHQLKEAEKFSAWMFTMTRNSIMDFYREKKKINEAVILNDVEEYNEFNDCVAACLNQLMATLPSPYREALEFTEKDHVPQKELAVRLGISYSGAKSRVQRARQMLKEKLEALYEIKTDGYGNVLACEDRVPCGCYEFESNPSLNM
jgi:RNA polymerase sigma-70 factor (ECF subfamily)